MSTSDAAKVGGVTFAESHWNKQDQKSGPTKNMITPDRRNDMEVTALIDRKGDKRTLCWWKCYLYSCASYHTLFSEEFLTDVKESDATMTGRCNAGTTVTKKKETYGYFQVWLNKKCIANLISIPIM